MGRGRNKTNGRRIYKGEKPTEKRGLKVEEKTIKRKEGKKERNSVLKKKKREKIWKKNL